MALIRRPYADPTLELFVGGVGVLSSARGFEGHVFTARSSFWSPFSPLRLQWWIFYVVVWADGVRERAAEDYPPFIAVTQMRKHYLVVDSEDASRTGRYQLRWLDPDEAAAARAEWLVGDDAF